MGVRGLSGSVKEHTVKQKIRLHELSGRNGGDIVIDGYSFFYTVTKECDWYNLWWIGGDMKTLEMYVSRVLKCLVVAGLKPILVFDGRRRKDKQSTDVERLKDKLDCVSNAISSLKQGLSPSFRHQTPPILSWHAFACGLMALGSDVRIVVTDEEADVKIAQLALALNTCVLSDDSDFFIFDIPGGCVSMTDVMSELGCGLRQRWDQLEACSNVEAEKLLVELAHAHLRVTHITREFLCKLFGLGAEHLPLFACLCGTDRFDSHAYVPGVFHEISRKGRAASRCAAVAAYVIELHQRVSTHCVDSVSKVLNTVQNKKSRSRIRAILVDEMNQYQPQQLSEEELSSISTQSKVPIHRCLLNVEETKEFWGDPVVEIVNGHAMQKQGPRGHRRLPGAYQCSLSMRRRLYAAIFAIDGHTNVVVCERFGVGATYHDEKVMVKSYASIAVSEDLDNFTSKCRRLQSLCGVTDAIMPCDPSDREECWVFVASMLILMLQNDGTASRESMESLFLQLMSCRWNVAEAERSSSCIQTVEIPSNVDDFLHGSAVLQVFFFTMTLMNDVIKCFDVSTWPRSSEIWSAVRYVQTWNYATSGGMSSDSDTTEFYRSVCNGIESDHRAKRFQIWFEQMSQKETPVDNDKRKNSDEVDTGPRKSTVKKCDGRDAPPLRARTSNPFDLLNDCDDSGDESDNESESESDHEMVDL